MNYEVIIGVEIHLELKTNTKMFSGAPALANASPNSCVSPVDIALPGTLPQLNKEAVRLALLACKALNCEIDALLRFDRKNYFYSDLPKGYQITQQLFPLGKNGHIDITTEGKSKDVRINSIMLEEDTAKQFHYPEGTYIDFNRSGIPLIEIVSAADMRNGAEAMAYVEKLRSILYYLGVSDCRMEEGSLRCDINISLRPYGYAGFGNKVEVKNLNSLANIVKAVDAEIVRQTIILNSGEEVVSATCRFDETSRKTVVMRRKDGAVDYKCFPEPNIPLIRLSEDFISEALNSGGELPDTRKRRYQDLGLNDYDSRQLVANKELGDYFDEVCRYSADAKGACNWLLGDFSAYLAKEQIAINESPIKAESLAQLLELINNQTISSKQAKLVFAEMTKGKKPQNVVAEKGITQVSDDSVIREIVSRVLSDNPQSIADYLGGKDRALGYLVGQVMKLSAGQVNPAKASSLLEEALAEVKEKSHET